MEQDSDSSDDDSSEDSDSSDDSDYETGSSPDSNQVKVNLRAEFIQN